MQEDNVFKRALDVYEGYWRIPDPVLMLLHWVTPDLQAVDYANMKLTDPDVVRVYALDCEMTIPQMNGIIKRMRKEFVIKESADYTFHDFIVLRQILCPWNKADIDRSRTHPSQYMEAASGMSKLQRCPTQVYDGLTAVSAQPETLWGAAELYPIEELVGGKHYVGAPGPALPSDDDDDAPDSR